MIYVIGDIHGMYDPFKILVDYIYKRASKTEQVNKIVLLGDYIDCGPSSKQVIDLILKLKTDFDTVALLGNHEEMLLSFYHKTFNHIKTGNFWLSFNGGLQTILSFYPQSILFRQEHFPNESMISDLLQYEDVFKLEPEYADFFDNLLSTYVVSLEQPERKLDLLFSHSVLSPRFSVEEQMAIRDWQGLHRFLVQNSCDLEETHIWNRQLLTHQLKENLTVIHGHTPTRYYRQLTKLLKLWEDEENSPFVVREKKNRKLVQIDIDTGLIYGGSLTMLAIDDTPNAENIYPYYISVDPRNGFRHKLFAKKELDLS